MNSDPDIRNQIIITDGTNKDYFNNISDIKFAARYSKNKNNYKIFKKLFLKMYNINKTDRIFYELVKITIRYEKSTSSINVIKLLIKYNINIIHYDRDDSTLLMYSCLPSINSLEMINLLIESGSNINIMDMSGQTVLMYLIENYEKNDDLEAIKLLIRKGSRINFGDEYGETRLMICFESHHNILIRYDIIKILLDNKADIYIKNDAAKNILDIVEKKIGRGSDIYSLIFNYKNIIGDHFCKFDIDFIYNL